ncbi:MAG: hypothetical protein H6744_03020 [Deltaproteobacteria bacterium]|nr:hypothetical protein [Deltaproteobacteria bacterium]
MLALFDAACGGGGGTADTTTCDGQAPCVDGADVPDTSARGLVATPELVEFGTVGLGNATRKGLQLFNDGSEPVEVTGFRLEGDPAFSLVLSDAQGDDVLAEWDAATSADAVAFDPPIALGPMAVSDRLQVGYLAAKAGDAEAVLTLTTNAASGDLVVLLRGRAATVCMDIRTEPLEFGCTAIGAPKTAEVAVRGCEEAGEADLVLHELRVEAGPSSAFVLDLGGMPRGDAGPMPAGRASLETTDPPVVIPPGTEARFRVAHAPTVANLSPVLGEPRYDEGAVVLVSNAGLPQRSIALSGSAYDPACPTPSEIIVNEGASVEPGTTLHLRSILSYTCASVPVVHQWSVLQPPGSQAELEPGPFSATPHIQVAVPGTYDFGLALRDSAGKLQCGPAESSVEVAVRPDLRIELTWTTPGSPDPASDDPADNADLDLHLLHPWAEGWDIDQDGALDGWFDTSFDCFWFNTDPNWGTIDPSIDDDPHLTTDSADQPRRERLDMILADQPITYKVGVHAWNDRSFGPSLATVRISMGGAVVFEAADVELDYQSMWEVATISWPQGVAAITSPGGAHKILPDYDSDFFPVP